MDYVVAWPRSDGSKQYIEKESAEQAFLIAKELIDAGTAGVEIHVKDNSIIRGRAILDICDAIQKLLNKRQ